MLPPLLASVNYGGVGCLCVAETVVSVLVAVFFMRQSPPRGGQATEDRRLREPCCWGR